MRVVGSTGLVILLSGLWPGWRPSGPGPPEPAIGEVAAPERSEPEPRPKAKPKPELELELELELEPKPLEMAVLVWHDDGVRFEMLESGQLAGVDLHLSLEPVLCGGGETW